MNTIGRIVLHAPQGSSGTVQQFFSSLAGAGETDRWLRRLAPWLPFGRPLGRAYLDFGDEAALLRWFTGVASRQDWEYVVILTGESAALTADLALELPDLDEQAVRAHGGGGQVRLLGDAERAALIARAKSAEAAELLVPLLAHALRGERLVTLPWTEPWLSEAVMWGLTSILKMIGDPRPLSFFTYAAMSGEAAELPGLLVAFRPGVRVVPPDPGFEVIADGLARRFATDTVALRRSLAQHGMLKTADRSGGIMRLLTIWPQVEADIDRGETEVVQDQPSSVRQAAASLWPPIAAGTSVGAVICPICLEEIPDWTALGYWQWDPDIVDYTELSVPAGMTGLKLARHLQAAFVRCPNPQGDGKSAHYLPADYGRFGPPVVLGFVGLSKSGKTHLMASMVGAIEHGELQDYGLSVRPLDHASHQRYLAEHVEPLLNEARQLQPTQENLVTFADAFLIKQEDGSGRERPVVLFDIAGGDLARDGAQREFLWIADGLFLVVDPDFLETSRVGDKTFSNVLAAVERSGRAGSVSAAIVLSKADKIRFDEPVTRWLRSQDTSLDASEMLCESADVYAYLQAHDAGALTRPYRECGKATLHFVSPSGGAGEGAADLGGTFPRGVTPCRVMRPLVAMLAMTGVVTGPEAEKVGI